MEVVLEVGAMNLEAFVDAAESALEVLGVRNERGEVRRERGEVGRGVAGAPDEGRP